MDFWQKVRQVSDEVGSSLGKMAKDVADNSKRAAERSKMKRNISNCKSKIEHAYMEIGKKFVKKYFEASDAQLDSDYSELINTIIDTQQELESLQSQLATLENASICSSCSEHVRNNQKFCSSCGARNEAYQEEAPKSKEEAAAKEESADSNVDVIEPPEVIHHS